MYKIKSIWYNYLQNLYKVSKSYKLYPQKHKMIYTINKGMLDDPIPSYTTHKYVKHKDNTCNKLFQDIQKKFHQC